MAIPTGTRIGPVSMLLVIGVLLGVPHGAAAQSSSPSPRVGYWTAKPDVAEMGGSTPPSRVDQAADEKPAGAEARRQMGREWLLAPLPMINPTLENGLAMVAGLLYPVGQSPPSASLVAGFRTSNDSWMAGGIQSLRLGADRYRLVGGAAYFDINFDFFGIGADAGDQGVSVPINQSGAAGLADLLIGVGREWYVGGRYRLSRTTIAGDFSQTTVPAPVPDFEVRTAVLGPRLQRDTRSNQFYPTAGTLFDATAGFAGKEIGGRRSYQLYQAAFSAYMGVTPRQVVAAKINSCAADGDVPFYDLCLLGEFQDLRGYPSGQYRDRRLLTMQAEYRLEVWKFFGVAAFGGTGEVAPAFDKLAIDALLPSGGAGLRFRLTRQTHINLRVDYAWGKNSSALYVSVAEAF